MFLKHGIKINKHVLIALATLLPVAITILATPQTYAQAVSNSANTLRVSPIRTDIEIPAGESKTVQVTVSNLTSGPITIRPIENDFTAGDERGTPALILDADKYAPTHSLKRFMSPLLDVTIPGGQAKTINVVITVPEGAQAGGYFGALRLAPTSPDGGGQVNLSASVASLILMTVPGDTVEKIELTDFSILQNGKSGEFFNTPNDLLATVRFENKGNVQIGPFGKLSVKQGDKVVYEADFNDEEPRDVILPDTARRWDIPLDKIGTFGHYTVIGTFTYGKSNQTIEVTESFWIIPMWAVITGIALIVLLIGLIIFFIVFFATRKRRKARKVSIGNGHVRRRR